MNHFRLHAIHTDADTSNIRLSVFPSHSLPLKREIDRCLHLVNDVIKIFFVCAKLTNIVHLYHITIRCTKSQNFSQFHIHFDALLCFSGSIISTLSIKQFFYLLVGLVRYTSLILIACFV